MATKKNTAKRTAVAHVAPEVKGKRERTVEDIKLSAPQQKEFDAQKTVSAKMRYLNSLDFANGAIAKFMGKRYQHVRNVLTTELKRKA